MEKRLLQLVLILIIATFVWQIWDPLWKYDLNESADSSNSEKIIFEVEKGSSAKTIAKNLESSDLIVNDKSFIRTVKSEELDQKLRYGKFVLSPSMTLREIITVLTTEGTGELALTIIEGETINDIDIKLTALDLIEAGAFRTCTFNCSFDYDFLGNDRSLEGFLFPDTYFIDYGTFTAEGFINQMLTNFDSKLTDEMQVKIAEDGRSIREVVNVASMLEKEVNTENNIATVAGIIWKRLDNDWMLGIDATLLYIDEDGILNAEDLSKESPYNTRINKGLPPTAIGNAGLKSLMGAIYPEESEFWFYLTTLDTGKVIYAITNEEHEANKEEYLY